MNGNPHWTRWQMPTVLDIVPPAPAGEVEPPPFVVPEDMLEAVRQQAREEAWAHGLEEGRQAARVEQRQLAQRWLGLIEQLARPLDALDADVEQQITELAILLGSQLARRELDVHPGQVVAIVREALKALPAGSHRIQIHLHPEDARLVASQLEPDGEHPWKIVENQALTRGGCQITSDGARLDERLEARLERLVQQLAGGDAVTGRVA